jgi:hypothetical protein
VDARDVARLFYRRCRRVEPTMKGRPVPIYRLTPPGELVEADNARQEGIHTVLRGQVLVIGSPREIVLRRVPLSVIVEVLDERA